MNQFNARMNFENAMNLAKSLGYNVEQCVPSQGFVRSEVAMSTGTSNYHVPILINDMQNGAARVLENRLDLQNILVVNRLFIGWTVASASTGTGKLYTYPNATAATSSAIVTQLQALYNAEFSLQINNRNIVPAWKVNNHWVSPRTQEDTNFNAALTAPGQYTIDQLDLGEDGFYPVEPNWVLNGAAQFNAAINLPTAMTSIPTNGAIVVIFDGVLLQNVTTVK
jgi:hypothetical protein